jgi:dGTPase
MATPTEMPDEFSDRACLGDEAVQARVVADYIAGMTDRFAIAEFERLD